jgi:hypothetical protein
MRELTNEEQSVLATVVTDPAAWWANANDSENVDHEAAITSKMAKWSGVHQKTRQVREDEAEAERAAHILSKDTFERRMAASDAILSRTEEDLADALVANGGTIPDALATKVADKKALRSAG